KFLHIVRFIIATNKIFLYNNTNKNIFVYISCVKTIKKIRHYAIWRQYEICGRFPAVIKD
ncbi:MAG: hypothetical protein NZM09_04360, partial [Ignavibacterium sp.]|nr:hypothetical protein [Ignavibacterium sp.]MDW8374910.1 hypothetical protein [Ignavibacteriales bacterium]